MQVLVADDDATYRGLLYDLLTKWHFEVVLAVDGQEALERMQADEPPRIALLDWEMPGMDGFQVARTIRATVGGGRAYVLMVTGSRRKNDLMQVLVCGADDYLIKPFDPMDLQIRMRTAMRIVNLQTEVEDLKARLGSGTAASR